MHDPYSRTQREGFAGLIKTGYGNCLLIVTFELLEFKFCWNGVWTVWKLFQKIAKILSIV